MTLQWNSQFIYIIWKQKFDTSNKQSTFFSFVVMLPSLYVSKRIQRMKSKNKEGSCQFVLAIKRDTDALRKVRRKESSRLWHTSTNVTANNK